MEVALSWGFGNVERAGLSGVGVGAPGPEPGSSSAHCLELGFSSAFQLGSSERPSTLSPVGREARFAPQVLTYSQVALARPGTREPLPPFGQRGPGAGKNQHKRTRGSCEQDRPGVELIPVLRVTPAVLGDCNFYAGSLATALRPQPLKNLGALGVAACLRRRCKSAPE